MPAPEYPYAARFVPAHPTNYEAWPDESRPIRRIVIHITDGAENISGTLSEFAHASKQKSAHYVISRDGEIVQMVEHRHKAWHARSANADSIGIEHVARSPGEPPWPPEDPGLSVTDEQYLASAKLVRWLCSRYGLPLDRDPIQGHCEADPQTNHTDCPNRIWDWDRYMALLRGGE